MDGLSWVAGALLIVIVVLMAVEVRRTWRRRVSRLPYLDGLDLLADHAGSGVWRLCPPCGYDTWDLYAPGTARDDQRFIVGAPAARFDANSGPGAQRYDGPERLADIEAWARPWIEQVTGRPVLQMHEGVSAPYGPGGRCREWVVFAVVEHPDGMQIEVMPPGREGGQG